MAKRLTEDWEAALSTSPTTLALCWRVHRRDQTVFCFTSCPIDLTLNDDEFDAYGMSLGSTNRTYQSAAGINPTEVNESSGSSPNNLNFEFLLATGLVTKRDLSAGLFDGAGVIVFTLNYRDLGMGPFEPWRGYIGRISKEKDLGSVEVNALAARAAQPFGPVAREICRWVFGSPQCGVDLSGNNPAGYPYTHEGQIVTGVTDRSRFTFLLDDDVVDPDPVPPPASQTLKAVGFVKTATQYPLPGVVVKLMDGATELDSATVDSTGYYELEAPSAGTYDIVPEYSQPNLLFSPSSREFVTSTSNGSRQNFNGYISGTSDPGAPTWGQAAVPPPTATVAVEGETAGFFKRGRIIWTGGANVGLQQQVQDYNSDTGLVTLWDEMPLEIEVGDEFTIIGGCEHTFRACWQDHDNAISFGAECKAPTSEEVGRVR